MELYIRKDKLTLTNRFRVIMQNGSRRIVRTTFSSFKRADAYAKQYGEHYTPKLNQI